MNKIEIVNIGGTLEAEALHILRSTPGLTVVHAEAVHDRAVADDRAAAHGGILADVSMGAAAASRAPRVDALVRFAGKKTPIAIEFKQRANAATAWDLVHRAHLRRKMALLLIAGETTAETRAILEKHRIGLIDGLGNVHLEIPGLMFHLEGRRRPRSTKGKKPRAHLRGKSGIVAQTLLLDPERAWSVMELAEQAQVSAALAHRVLMRLEGENIAAAEGMGPKRVRRITNPTALLDLWAEETVERPARTFAYLLAPTPKQLIKDLGANIERGGLKYALTGAAAASLVAPFITAVPVVELWVTASATPRDVCEAAGARPVADGQNAIFLQAKDDGPLAFREELGGLWVANRFRVYADLRSDPRRGREQADHLRREVIGF